MTKVAVEYTGKGPIRVQLRPGLVARWDKPGVIHLPADAAAALLGSHAIGGGMFRAAALPEVAPPTARKGKK